MACLETASWGKYEILRSRCSKLGEKEDVNNLKATFSIYFRVNENAME